MDVSAGVVARDFINDLGRLAQVQGRSLEPVEVGLRETAGFVVLRHDEVCELRSQDARTVTFKIVHLGAETRPTPQDRHAVALSETTKAIYKVRSSGAPRAAQAGCDVPTVMVRESSAANSAIDARDTAFALHTIFARLARSALRVQERPGGLLVEVDLLSSTVRIDQLAQLAGSRMADKVLRSNVVVAPDGSRRAFRALLTQNDFAEIAAAPSALWAASVTTAALALCGRSGNVQLPDRRYLLPHVAGSARYGDVNATVKFVDEQSAEALLRLEVDVRSRILAGDADLTYEPGVALMAPSDVRLADIAGALVSVMNAVAKTVGEPRHADCDIAIARSYFVNGSNFDIRLPGFTRSDMLVLEENVPGVVRSGATTFSWKMQPIHVLNMVKRISESLAKV